MKQYTANEVAEMINADEVIYMGYFDNKGREVTKVRDGVNGVQKWSGCAIDRFKSIANVLKGIKFVKVEDGYSTMFVYKLK